MVDSATETVQATYQQHSDTPPGPLLLHTLTPVDMLSFGSELRALTFRNLNVLVGPNGSGKSNLLELIDLLRSTPGDFGKTVSRGGGPTHWIWKGAANPGGAVAAVLTDPAAPGLGRRVRLLHSIGLHVAEQRLWFAEESVTDVSDKPPPEAPVVYSLANGRAQLTPSGAAPRDLPPESIRRDVSILALRRDPDAYPELAGLTRAYEGIRLYREWQFGRGTILRQPQRADLRSDRLEEDFSNLGLVLNRMRRQPRAKAALIERLRDLYDGLTDVDVSVEGGTVQVFFTEGDYVIPATRLSDGSLRYLCLLAILLDPDPPPLIGLEEPELGLHPDLLPKIADLLVDASTRTQLIVTTHSDAIIDALSDRPESVVVFDKHDGRTTFERLDRDALAGWLEKYRLGQLWTRGQIGGTRW